MWAGSSASPSSKIFELNLPCYHPLAVFLPRLGFTSMLLLNRVRKYALVAIFRIHFLARKRCFLGGTDTSGGVETLRQSPGLLTDGGRRKKRDVDFTIPKHIGIRARVEYGFQRINHRIGERGAIQRRQPRRCGSNHWRPPRNRVRKHPETRPAKSPRAPAAATPSFHPDLTPQVSRLWWGPPGLRGSPWTRSCLDSWLLTSNIHSILLMLAPQAPPLNFPPFLPIGSLSRVLCFLPAPRVD